MRQLVRWVPLITTPGVGHDHSTAFPPGEVTEKLTPCWLLQTVDGTEPATGFAGNGFTDKVQESEFLVPQLLVATTSYVPISPAEAAFIMSVSALADGILVLFLRH